MKATQVPLFTSKDISNDVQVASHKLLVKAGYIKKQSAGIYSFLPFGYIVHRKIENIIREEMDAFGGVEVHLPIITAQEQWETSGRWDKMGSEMMRFTDRHDNGFVLSPTHEEAITHLVAGFLSSYKQLPINFYQIGVKYRDEVRPRYGLIRGREFVMKDAYSFHVDEDSLHETYEEMSQCYHSIFKRCCLSVIAVQADSGAMGGSTSEEFMVPSEVGEETLLLCTDQTMCRYQSNQEKTEHIYNSDDIDTDGDNAYEEVLTPDKTSIEDVSQFLGVLPSQVICTIILENENRVVVVCISGDRDLNIHKVQNILQTNNLSMATETTIQKVFSCESGYLGVLNLSLSEYLTVGEEQSKKVHLLIDQALQNRKCMVVGANKKNYHVKNVDTVRDFNWDSSYYQHDLILAEEGDTCPKCRKEKLTSKKGIEVGHIFKLGKKYTEAFNLVVHDENGKTITPTMGCYGIGVSRTIATIVEEHHDHLGIVWPKSISPFVIYLIGLGKSSEEKQKEEELYKELSKHWSVYYDNRSERPGVKFHDFELLGFPIGVVVGKNFFNDGQFDGLLEVKVRKTQEAKTTSQEDLISSITVILEVTV